MLQFREVASSIAWAFQELYQKQISGASPVSPTKLADGRPCKLRDTPVTALPNSRWPRRLPVVNVNRARLITPLPACLQCFIPSTLKKDIFRFVFSPRHEAREAAQMCLHTRRCLDILTSRFGK